MNQDKKGSIGKGNPGLGFGPSASQEDVDEVVIGAHSGSGAGSISIGISTSKEGEDEYGEYTIWNPSKSSRKGRKDAIEIGNCRTYTMTLDLGDTQQFKFLIKSSDIPSDEQRKNLKEMLGLVVRTRAEDEAINGKHVGNTTL